MKAASSSSPPPLHRAESTSTSSSTISSCQEAVDLLLEIGDSIDDNGFPRANENSASHSSSSLSLHSYDFENLFAKIGVLVNTFNFDSFKSIEDEDQVRKIARRDDCEGQVQDEVLHETNTNEDSSAEPSFLSSASSSSTTTKKTKDRTSTAAALLYTIMTDVRIMKALMFTFQQTMSNTNVIWPAVMKFINKFLFLSSADTDSRRFFRLKMLEMLLESVKRYYSHAFPKGDVLDSTDDKSFAVYNQHLINDTRLMEFFTHYCYLEIKRFVAKCNHGGNNNSNYSNNNNNNTSSFVSSSTSNKPTPRNIIKVCDSESDALTFIKMRNESYQAVVAKVSEVAYFGLRLLDDMTSAVERIHEELSKLSSYRDDLIETINSTTNNNNNNDNNNNNNSFDDDSQQQQQMVQLNEIESNIKHLREHHRVQRSTCGAFAKKFVSRFEAALTILGNVYGMVAISTCTGSNNNSNNNNNNHNQLLLPIIPVNVRLEICSQIVSLAVTSRNCNNSNDDNDHAAVTAAKVSACSRAVVAFLRDVPAGLILSNHAIVNSRVDSIHENVFYPSSSSSPSDGAGITSSTNPLVRILRILLDCVSPTTASSSSSLSSTREDHLFHFDRTSSKHNNNKPDSSSLLLSSRSVFDAVLADSLCYAAGIVKDHELTVVEETEETKEWHEASDFQNIVQDFGVAPRWFLAAARCMSVLMSVAPSDEDEPRSTAEVDKKIFKNNNTECHTKLAQILSPIYNNISRSSDDAVSKKFSSKYHDIAPSIALSSDDWDLIGSWLIESVTTCAIGIGNFCLCPSSLSSSLQDGGRTDGDGGGGGSSNSFPFSFISPLRDITAERVTALWITAAHFCNYANNNNNTYQSNNHNDEHHHHLENRSCRKIPHLLHDRSDIFASWLFALAHRVIDLVRESQEYSRQSSSSSSSSSRRNSKNSLRNDYDSSNNFNSQLSVWAVEIFNRCAEIQPVIVGSVVSSLWEEFKPNVVDCASLNSFVQTSSATTTTTMMMMMRREVNAFVTQFLCSITSDVLVGTFPALVKKQVQQDEYFSFEAFIDNSIFAPINDNRRAANTLVAIEFYINLCAKNFASHSCQRTMANVALGFGYGLLTQAKSNILRSGSKAFQGLDLLEIVDSLMKDEESEFNASRHQQQQHQNQHQNQVPTAKDRNLNKVQRTITLVASFIRITTSLLRFRYHEQRGSFDNSNSNTRSKHENQFSEEALLSMLQEILTFTHSKFFRFSEYGNTSNYLDGFFDSSTREEFLSVHLCNIATDILQLLSEKFFTPFVSSSSSTSSSNNNDDGDDDRRQQQGSSSRDFFARFHTLGVGLIMNICNLFLSPGDSCELLAQHNSNNLNRTGEHVVVKEQSDFQKSWVLFTIGTFFFKYAQTWQEVALSHVPNDHPSLESIIMLMNDSETFQEAHPLSLVSTANSGAIVHQIVTKQRDKAIIATKENNIGDHESHRQTSCSSASASVSCSKLQQDAALSDAISRLVTSSRLVSNSFSSVMGRKNDDANSLLGTKEREQLQEVFKTVTSLMNMTR